MPKIVKFVLIGVGIFLLMVVLLMVNTSVRTLRTGDQSATSFGGPVNRGMMYAPKSVSGGMGLGMPAPAPGRMMTKDSAEIASQFTESADVPSLPAVEKKIIKNGNLTLQVKNTDDSSSRINQIAKDNGGDVFSSNFFEERKGIKSGSITIKVPVANFEKAYSEIKKVATLIVQESTSGQDVTEEYTDLQSQLKNKQAEEAQFVKIMEQAQKIQDILDVTRQLSRVRGEIEMLQGRIKFLNSQADLASIFINLTEDANITVADSWRPWQVFKDSVNRLIKEGQGLISSVIYLVVVALPIIFIYLLFFYIAYIIGRKIYQKLKEKNNSV